MQFDTMTVKAARAHANEFTNSPLTNQDTDLGLTPPLPRKEHSWRPYGRNLEKAFSNKHPIGLGCAWLAAAVSVGTHTLRADACQNVKEQVARSGVPRAPYETTI